MESSTDSAGASEQVNDQDALPDGMTHLTELLAADGSKETSEGGSSGEDDAASSGSDDKTQPTKFNDLAGKLGMELDALYKLEISSSEDGEPVTIEQLKDSHKDRADFDLKVIEFEERRTQQEQDLMRAKSELQEILQALPKNSVRPEVLERIREKSEKTTALERQKTLEVIPEWNDEDVRQSDIAGMAKHLEGYGFPLNYLKQVVSHQQLKYIRDNWQREQRIRAALEKVRAAKPDKSIASKPQKAAPKKGTDLSKIKRGKSSSKLEAVFSNLE